MENLQAEQKKKNIKAYNAWKKAEDAMKKKVAKTYELEYLKFVNQKFGCVFSKDKASYLLTKAEKNLLFGWIGTRDIQGYPVRPWEIVALANSLIQARRDSSERGRRTKKVASNWPKRFVNESSYLAINMKFGLVHFNEERAIADRVNAFTCFVNENLRRHKVVPKDVHYLCESGFQMGPAASLVSTDGNSRFETDEKDRITILECFNATGFSLPPFIGHTCDKAVGAISTRLKIFPKTFSRNDIRSNWLITHFIPYLEEAHRQDSVKVLIINWHRSVPTYDFTEVCRAYGIVPLCVPEDTWHCFSCLDTSTFSALKPVYRDAANKVFSHDNHADLLAHIDTLMKTRSSSTRAYRIRELFEKAGFIPYKAQNMNNEFDTKDKGDKNCGDRLQRREECCGPQFFDRNAALMRSVVPKDELSNGLTAFEANFPTTGTGLGLNEARLENTEFAFPLKYFDPEDEAFDANFPDTDTRLGLYEARLDNTGVPFHTGEVLSSQDILQEQTETNDVFPDTAWPFHNEFPFTALKVGESQNQVSDAFGTQRAPYEGF